VADGFLVNFAHFHHYSRLTSLSLSHKSLGSSLERLNYVPLPFAINSKFNNLSAKCARGHGCL
jgi:hypothetical protein